MKTNIIIGFICLMLGSLIGWQISSMIAYNQFGTTLQLLKEGELAVALSECKSAYFSNKWEIAIWELNRANHKLDDYIVNHYADPRYLKREQFIVNARLAKSYDEIGNERMAKEQAALAIELMKSSGLQLPITNSTSLFTALTKIDLIDNNNPAHAPEK